MPSRRSSHQQFVKAAAFSLIAMLALIGLTHDGNAQEVPEKDGGQEKDSPQSSKDHGAAVAR